MKNTFELLDDICYTKPDYQIVVSDEFVPFQIQRWLSFASLEMAVLMNNIFNVKYVAFNDDKQMAFDYLKCILPKKRLGKITYVKKVTKKTDSKHNDIIKEMAKIWEISEKEAADNLDVSPELIKDFEDKSKILQKS